MKLMENKITKQIEEEIASNRAQGRVKKIFPRTSYFNMTYRDKVGYSLAKSTKEQKEDNIEK